MKNRLAASPSSLSSSGKTTEQLVEKLTCIICLNIVSEPMEPNCLNNCAGLICAEHINKLYTCPFCKTKANWKKNRVAEQFLELVPHTCSDCSETLPIQRLNVHRISCPMLTRQCTCGFKGRIDIFTEHLFRRHYFELLHNFHG